LLELGAELESRDLDKERLSEAEIEALIGEEPQSDSQTCGASRITNGAWL
jgi:hypothetical protein